MAEKLPISGPLSVGDLLDHTFRLYRARFWELLVTAAVLLVPAAVLTGLFNAFIGEMTMAATVAGQEPSPADLGMFGLVSVIIWLLTFVAAGVTELALTYRSGALLYARDFGLGESVRRGFGRLLGYVGMRIAQGVAFLILAVPLLCIFAFVFGGALGTLGLFAEAGALDDGGGAVAGIGGMLLFTLLALLIGFVLTLPFLLLYARWIVAVPCLAFEGAGPIESLRRSWHLTKNQTFRALGYTILLGLLVFLVTGLPMLLVNQVLVAVLPPNPGLIQGVVASAQSLVNVIWQPIYVAAIVFLYYDLRVRREASDLDVQIDRLEQDVARSRQDR